ncbi:tetratricopeptide repeat protein, partial [Fulvivirga kasyanovii]|nr:tetratricopeptide repeat protein [Fulvivirga kasyanovii]
MNLLISLRHISSCLKLFCLTEAKNLSYSILRFKPILLMLVCCFIGHTAVSQKYVHAMDSVQELLETLPEDDTSKVYALIYMAELQSSKPGGDVRKYADEALELAEALEFKPGMVKAYFALAYYFVHGGNGAKALECLYKALDMSIELQDPKLEAYSYNFLGYVNKSLREYDEALKYYNKALDYWGEKKNSEMKVLILGNIANIHLEKGDKELALKYYYQILDLAKEHNMDSRLSSVYWSLGQYYYEDKNYEKALEYLHLAQEYARKTESTWREAKVYHTLSKIYLAMNQPQEALSVAEKSLHLTSSLDLKNEMLESYQQLYLAFEKLGNYQQAYEYQEKYRVLSDSIKNQESVQAIERLKHQHEIKLVNEIHKANVLRRNALIGVLVALLIIVSLFFNRRYLLMKKNLENKRQLLNYSIRNLKEKSELVEKVNKELQIFKQNANHEVKIKKFNRVLQFNIVTDDDWENFKKAFEDVYPNFMASLRYHYPDLTTAEIRQAALVKMKLTIKETASILGITPESVKKSRHRLKKKLKLTEKE